MATTKTTNTTEVKEAKEFAKPIILLWKEKGKKGTSFLKSKYYTGFYNTRKKNPNEPDVRIYKNLAEGGISQEEYASLWCNVSEKTGNKYLGGHLTDDKAVKLIGFIKKEKKNEKQPDVEIYLQEEFERYNPKQEGAIKQESKQEKPINEDELPF